MEETMRTLPELLDAPRKRTPLVCLLLLLTFNAGWTDTLCYLSLSHVFSSFMTGNFLFIGLALAQGNHGLLVRAIVAVLVYLVGVTCGSFRLGRAPQQAIWPRWLTTLIRYLLLEWMVFLVFAVWWEFTGDLPSHAGTQIILLVLAAFAMGLQGALVQAFEIPGVVANALTGTVLLLGRRLAQDVGGPVAESQKEWKRNRWFLVVLCLIYILSAPVVLLTRPFLATPFGPVLIVTIVMVVLLTSFWVSRHADDSEKTRQ